MIMSKKHLDRAPKQIRPGVWFYEENGGLEVYINDRLNGGQSVSFTVPVASIRAYLRRKDK